MRELRMGSEKRGMTQYHYWYRSYHYLIAPVVTGAVVLLLAATIMANPVAAQEASSQQTDPQIITDKPVVTIMPSMSGRTISGTVSQSDVSFRVVIDGVETTILPAVTPPTTAGAVSNWSMVLPDSVADGDHDISVYATPSLGGIESDVAESTITVSTIIVPAPPGDTKSPVSTTAPIPTVPQIGQFIAPDVPAPSSQAKKKLYGVPVDDIAPQSQSNTSNQPVKASSSGTVISIDDAKQSQDRSPALFKPTPTGWEILGTAWYWWTIGIVIAAIPITVIFRTEWMRRLRQNFRPNTTSFRTWSIER